MLTEKFITKVFNFHHRLFLRHLSRDKMNTWTLNNLELSVRSMGNNVRLVMDARMRKWARLVRFQGQHFNDALGAIVEQAGEINFVLNPLANDAHQQSLVYQTMVSRLFLPNESTTKELWRHLEDDNFKATETYNRINGTQVTSDELQLPVWPGLA